MTLSAHARRCRDAIAVLANDIARASAMVPESRTAAVNALVQWEAACIREVGAHRHMVLPIWPRSPGGIPTDPGCLATVIRNYVGDSGALDGLAAECGRWAREWDKWNARKGAA